MASNQYDEAVRLATELVGHCASLTISTVNGDGQPLASYAPYYRDCNGHVFIFVSTLSAHTQNLLGGNASVLIIEDESQCKQIFARKRVVFQCKCFAVPPTHAKFSAILDKLDERHRDRNGDIVNTLKGLADFILVRLEPQSGSFVMGFGQAYTIDAQITSAEPVMPAQVPDS